MTGGDQRAESPATRLMLVRQLASIAALPFTVAVLVPLWLLGRQPTPPSWPATAAVAAGGALLLCGLALFAWCVRLFWRRGRGTLAPWDPPRHFVAEGPYRHVRNPMITGVFLVLVGEALILRSGALGWWVVVFAAINAVYIPLSEEPGLEARFGASYRAYRQAVPRFVPRRRAYRGS
jgi:protein-S-isoprenylcysteine O-methyltransferase Ste14